jgi:hypothetical protein
MKRPPFKIVGSTHSTYRRDGRFITSGRTSWVWEQLVIAIASGVPGVHEIQRGDGPWHRIDMTVEEAEQALNPRNDFFGRRRVARARQFRNRKETS